MLVRQVVVMAAAVCNIALLVRAAGPRDRVMPSLDPHFIQARVGAEEKLRSVRAELVLDEGVYSHSGLDATTRPVRVLRFRTDYIESAIADPVIAPDAVDDQVLEATLPFFPELLHLDLAMTRATDAGLCALRHSKSLRSLSLASTHPKRFPSLITNRGLGTVSRVAGQLEALHLLGLPITDEGVKYLGDMRGLKSLTIINCHITSGSLAWVARLPGLQELSLGQSCGYFPTENTHCDLNLAVTSELKEAIARLGSKVERLSLYGQIHPSLLLSFSQLQSLRSVDLSEAETSPSAVAEFVRRVPTLESLRLATSVVNADVRRELVHKPPESLGIADNILPILLRRRVDEVRSGRH